MELVIEKVFERDIDLLIINKFVNDENFSNLFLSKINKLGYKLNSIEHSLTDSDGESDITVILEKSDRKIAILIEDKIDAIAMPEQNKRYLIRGNKGIRDKKYEDFFVFIIAPKEYLIANQESKKYDYRISYEEIIEYLKNKDLFAKTLLEKAIQEKNTGYIVVENKNVTKFWEEYYKFIRLEYPKLNINEVKGPRGSNANWPIFKTDFKKVKIIHKSDKGYIDLTFEGTGDKTSKFIKIIKPKLFEDMSIHRTGKSMVVRLIVPYIDFQMEFSNFLNEMKICMEAVVRLEEFLENIDVEELYER